MSKGTRCENPMSQDQPEECVIDGQKSSLSPQGTYVIQNLVWVRGHVPGVLAHHWEIAPGAPLPPYVN